MRVLTIMSIVSIFYGCVSIGDENERLSQVGFEQEAIFISGQDGYYTYRIPAIVVSNQGTILAFCEGRKTSRSDHGDIDLLLKRSTDNGNTWTPQQVIYEEGRTAKITIGNPAPVVDRDTGIIWLAFCRNNSDVFVTHSTDDGLTWANPRNITESVKNSDWDWYATGPVNGIQMQSGPYKGRLVIPCDHNVRGRDDWQKKGRSHAIYSDDHGKMWKTGEATDWSTNECTVVELVDGSLYLNMRSYKGNHCRQIVISTDGGHTWGTATEDTTLVEPVCQASAVRYTTKDKYLKNRILFSNPASEKRIKMTVRISYDEGNTWPVAKEINSGPSAYSNLCILPDGTIACLYERGEENPYETITFARMSLEWVTDGRDRLKRRRR
ncbi:MAG: sialidase family protein [bacterium]